jgi:hypothetical protein
MSFVYCFRPLEGWEMRAHRWAATDVEEILKPVLQYRYRDGSTLAL